MAMYKPSLPFSTPLKLLIPTYATKQGVKVKTFPTVEDGILFFGSFKTYGGTETTSNGVLSVEDTANIETWYRPDINSNCRVALAETGAVYEIIGQPEDIYQRHQWLTFKVRRVKGGA